MNPLQGIIFLLETGLNKNREDLAKAVNVDNQEYLTNLVFQFETALILLKNYDSYNSRKEGEG